MAKELTTTSFQEKVGDKVRYEYDMWYNHIRQERQRKRTILNKVLDPNLPQGQVRINLLWKNLQLENSLFLTDKIWVKILWNEWELGQETAENANKVLEYDDRDMDLYEMRETIVNDNGLYGLSATMIDWWDDDEKQPISDTISPLSLIIDPKNYSWSKLRFVWVSRRVPVDTLKTSSFDQNKIKILELSATDQELTLNEQSQTAASNLRLSLDNEWMVDIYDHFNIFNWKKYLSTWINNNTECIRVMEIAPLTEAERLKPTKVHFPIQLHRRKPKPWSVFGVSIADEILVFQDAISQLTNLQLLNSRIQALWPDIFVDEKLWVDTTLLSQGKPGWRIIPISNKTGMPTQNGMFKSEIATPNQYTDVMIKNLENRAEQTTNISGQNFWDSQSGTQTKAEIQTLQQNANKILVWITNNYLRWQKDYWLSHYRAYAENMWKGKKIISLFQKGNAISLDLEKDDFIQDWKVNIIITSKSQEQIKNDQEFNKLSILANLYLPNMTSAYAKNIFLRSIWEKSNIRDFDSDKYIRKTVDERRAEDNLELLNNNKEVPTPQMWDDADVYLDIYDQAMDTDAKEKAMKEWSAYADWVKEQEAKQQQMQQPWQQPSKAGQWDPVVWNMAMNNLNQNSQSIPSTQWISL